MVEAGGRHATNSSTPSRLVGPTAAKNIGAKTSYKYADVLTAICDVGFLINKQDLGKQTKCVVATSGKVGAWEAFPTCAAIRCGSPGTAVAKVE